MLKKLFKKAQKKPPAKKRAPSPVSRKQIEKPVDKRILTAEGWRRLMMKKMKKK